MGFAAAIRSCLGQYVGFRGRASRAEYWWFTLALFLAGLVAALIDDLVFGVTGSGTIETIAPAAGVEGTGVWAELGQGPVASLLGLVTFLPALAVAVRRLHDTERSGWLLLAPFAIAFGGPVVVLTFAPLFGGILAGVWVLAFLAALLLPLWWFVQPGTPGPNAYGPDPLETAR